MPTDGINISSMVAQLKAQRIAMDEAIAALEKLESLGFGSMQAPSGSSNNNGSVQEIQRDTFFGMSIADAAKKFLGMSGRKPQTTDAITDALGRGGLSARGDSVGTILVRVANQEGDIVRVGRGLWGLLEWYPGRPRKAKKKVEGDSNIPAVENSKGTDDKDPDFVASVSFMITKAQRAKLIEKGYTEEQIAVMKPAEAHDILQVPKA